LVCKQHISITKTPQSRSKSTLTSREFTNHFYTAYSQTETMGQEQSQPSASQRPPEPQLSKEERAQLQAEVWSSRATILAMLTSPKMRANQQAALDKRLNQPRKSSPAGAQSTRKPTALEEASRENIGWRNADAQAEFRNWN